MRFEMETVYDASTLKAFSHLVNNTLRFKQIRAVRVIAAVIGCVCMLNGILWTWVKEPVPAVCDFILGILFLVTCIFYRKYLFRDKRIVVKDLKTVRYIFEESGYLTRSDSSQARTDYKMIRFLCEDECHFAIMLDRRQGFILNKSGFKSGSPANFVSFMEHRTGKKFLKLIA